METSYTLGETRLTEIPTQRQNSCKKELMSSLSARPGCRRGLDEAHLLEAEGVKQIGEVRFRVFRGEGEDAFLQRLAADAAFGGEARAAFEAGIGAAEETGVSVDDVRLFVVDARDEHLGRR